MPGLLVDSSGTIRCAMEFRIVEHDEDIVRCDVDVCVIPSVSRILPQSIGSAGCERRRDRPVSMPSAPALQASMNDARVFSAEGWTEQVGRE